MGVRPCLASLTYHLMFSALKGAGSAQWESSGSPLEDSACRERCHGWYWPLEALRAGQGMGSVYM